MKNLSYIFASCLLSITFFLSGCNENTWTVPGNCEKSDSLVVIYPDYTNIVIPPNIAPLNFNIPSKPEKAIVEITGENGECLVVGTNDQSSVIFNEEKWHSLLQDNLGKKLTVIIYTLENGKWFSHPAYSLDVAQEEIDPYLSYRLIEPGYISYNKLGIYQRDLRSFDKKPIYENEGDHCINCHTFQDRKTKRMMFHVREVNSGTIITDGDNVFKVNTKTDSMFASCVYASWHPTLNKIAFSSNHIGQFFYLVNKQRAEVVDHISDLVIYDVDKKEVTPVITTDNCLETFPSWSPKGDRLYYSVCTNMKDNPIFLHGNKVEAIAKSYDSIRYNICSMSYDTLTGEFGPSQTEIDAYSEGMSATFARVSPDGKWLLYTQGKFGQFHVWHKSSDLYIKDLQSGQIRPLSTANSSDVESFHTWSSNGRWIVFSSRREDKCYTRPYFCYFDKNGKDYKAFVIPEEDPLFNKLLLKSYNLPEFTVEPVRISPEKFRDVIMNTEAAPSTYSPQNNIKGQ